MEHSLTVNGESVSCPDGQKISLEDLRDVSAPRILIGVDPSLHSGEVSSVISQVRRLSSSTGIRARRVPH